MPFAEDDVVELVKHLPIENVIYGSDWPHPEGLAEPEDYIFDLKSFTPAEQRLIMRDNLRKMAGLPV
jgi:predicted TIM-barrel fold metal-dependent hydrolase